MSGIGEKGYNKKVAPWARFGYFLVCPKTGSAAIMPWEQTLPSLIASLEDPSSHTPHPPCQPHLPHRRSGDKASQHI